jgi:class 3 adenylate cyclase
MGSLSARAGAQPRCRALLASRVERLTRAHPADVLITAPVRANLDPRFALEELPAREVHGVAEPVLTYAVRGFRDA